MKKLNEYLYMKYESRRGELKEAKRVRPGIIEAYNQIREMYDIKTYTRIIEEIENEADDMAYDGYVKGFKDGMKFLLNMVTE